MDEETPEGFQELVENAPVMLWRSGTDKLYDFFNKPWLQFTGRTPEQEAGLGWAQGVHPEDYDRCLNSYVTAFDARQPFRREYRLRHNDGQYRWILESGKPYFREGGEFAGYFGSCIDIENRLRLEKPREALIEELNHRVKNVLAVVLAIGQQTLQSSETAQKGYEVFSSRVMALAHAHDLLDAEQWQGADLGELVRNSVSAHEDDQIRFTLTGGPARIEPHASVSLAMLLNELITNAEKYGALGTPGGTVSIDWQIYKVDTKSWIQLDWQEHGGRIVANPGLSGFGLRLITRMLPSDLGGAATLTFDPPGLRYHIEFPQ